MDHGIRGRWILAMALGLIVASVATAETADSPDLVSFSFNEPSSDNYVPNELPEHVQDTIFAPNDAWFPLIRFVGWGVNSSIEVDAISYGHDADSNQFDAFFSVGLGSQGLPGTAVFNENPEDERYSDIYASDKGGDNTLIYDGDGSTAEPLGVLENASTNVDAIDMRASSSKGLIYWSVSQETAENENPYMAAVASGADIFVGQEDDGYSTALPLTPYAQAWALGLTGTDDLDALVVIDPDADGLFDPTTDTIYFSLVDGSTSLVASGVAPFQGAGPADIFMVGGGLVTPIVAATALKLGLEATDELDGLDLAVREEILIALPEPDAVWQLVCGITLLLSLASSRRHRVSGSLH